MLTQENPTWCQEVSEPQNPWTIFSGPIESILVLGVSKFAEGVSSHPPVSSENVEVPIFTEQQLTPVVVGCWFCDLQDDPTGRAHTYTHN